MSHRIRRSLFPAMVLLGLLVSFAQPLAVQTAPPHRYAQPDIEDEARPAQIEDALLNALAVDGTTDLVVVMAEQADFSAAVGMGDWSARGRYVYDALREVASRTQAPVIAYAQRNALTHRSFLSANAVFIKAGDMVAVQEVAALPGVALVRLPKVAHIEPTDQDSPPSPDAYGWNLDTLDPAGSQYGMQAAQVWSQYGVRGEGIVVANIDTGVFYQHEALDRQYRGNLTGSIGGPYDHDYNWYMPTFGCGDGTYPCDNNGHGSGTAGIMAGETQDLAEQIGAAPAAQWIACKGCESGSCSEAALTACADWMVAPCPIGVDPGDPSCDPDKRPHIVNNSWGGGGCDTWYQSYIAAWVAAGIFPAFSAGNTAACRAVGSPGDNPAAFGTAAHSSSGTNLYAGGPSCFSTNPSCSPSAHEVDPHLNAPTYGRTSDNYAGGYYNLSGTSGASPHTAGAVALIWSANPGYIGQIEPTFTVLEQSADHDVPAGSCGKPICAGANPYPNYEYGWGYLDALAAVEMAQTLLASPNVGSFDPHGGSGSVGVWADLTTTYTDPNGYQDIAGAFLFLDRQPPIASGGLAAAYVQPSGLLWLKDGGVCEPGEATSLSTAFVTLDCANSSVSGAGDTLTIHWRIRPEQCFTGGCGWNYAIELVTDSGGLEDAGLVGWWRLGSEASASRASRPTSRPTERDLQRLKGDVKAWQADLGW
jgi:hypothetical protein